MKRLKKINKYHIWMFVAVVLLSLLSVVAVNVGLSSFNISKNPNEEIIGSVVHVEKSKIDNAYEIIIEREIVPLDLD